jgi:hypothetical protein
MFLSALYTIFAVLLFLCYASETILSKGHHNHRDDHHDHRENGIKASPLVPVNTGDQHQHQRHTMDNNPGLPWTDHRMGNEKRTAHDIMHSSIHANGVLSNKTKQRSKQRLQQ